MRSIISILPRLYLGVIFLYAGGMKLLHVSTLETQVGGFLHAVAMQSGFPWYQSFVGTFVLPHVSIFAPLIMVAELFVAVTMLAGRLTRAGAMVAIVLLANYLCAKGMLPWYAASNDWADIVLALLVIYGRTSSR